MLNLKGDIRSALRSVKLLERSFARDAGNSELNRFGWWLMFGSTVNKFHLHNLPIQAYFPFAVFNYVATGGLHQHIGQLLALAKVDVVPLPFDVRRELQWQQIQFGNDLLHAMVLRGIEHWPFDRRGEVVDHIFGHTPVADILNPYPKVRDEVLKELLKKGGSKDQTRRVLHFVDGAAYIVGAIAPDAYVDENGLNWGAGI